MSFIDGTDFSVHARWQTGVSSPHESQGGANDGGAGAFYMPYAKVQLREPACARRCDPCVQICALKQISLRWWEKEFRSLMMSQLTPTDDGWQETQAALSEARERLKGIRRDIELVCPQSRAAYLELRRAASAPASHR